MRIHFLIADLRLESNVRYIARLRKGYASPSLHAASACNKRRTLSGTYLAAKVPPIMALARMGSVGVKHAEIASEEANDSEGNTIIKRP